MRRFYVRNNGWEWRHQGTPELVNVHRLPRSKLKRRWLTRGQAVEKAIALARAEMDKLNKSE
jgi:hypothetical protein